MRSRFGAADDDDGVAAAAVPSAFMSSDEQDSSEASLSTSDSEVDEVVDTMVPGRRTARSRKQRGCASTDPVPTQRRGIRRGKASRKSRRSTATDYFSLQRATVPPQRSGMTAFVAPPDASHVWQPRAALAGDCASLLDFHRSKYVFARSVCTAMLWHVLRD